VKGLHLVTDRALCGARGVDEVVRLAAQGGVASVQLREKTLPTRDFVEAAARLLAILAPHQIPLIINDRLDVALTIGAQGVHLGQSDLQPGIARRLLGPRALIGLSVETWADVVRAEEEPVDYLGVSPVFATATKTDTQPPWGIEGVARIRAFSRHPLVAIGGLNETNLAQTVRAGAAGIAVVSAICAAKDPLAATQALLQRMTSG
jgi:thiamine-phosphate pyrophosphorylase